MQQGRYQLAFRTYLPASASTVLAGVLTPAGVNAELHPWLSMRFPAPLPAQLQALPLHTRLGRCWLLLFGLIPVDYDDLSFNAIHHDGFEENSVLFSQRLWTHTRRVTPLPQGCELSDELRFTPRLPGTGWLSLLIIRQLFNWRHRQLRRLYRQ